MPRLPASLAAALALAAFVSGCAADPSRSPATPSDAAKADSTSRTRARTTGWVLVAVGAHAGAVAVGTSAMMLREASVRDGECTPDKLCSSDGIQANGRLERLAPWNAGAWIVAGAGLGAGLYLLLTNPVERRPGAVVGITPTPGGAVLQTKF